MTDGMQVLQRNYLPQHLEPLLLDNRIDACIAVQARADEAETDFLLQVADNHDWVAGVIGWVDLRADDVASRMARWDGSPKLRGYRHQLQDEADVQGVVRDPRFKRGIEQVQAAGKIYEVLVLGNQLDSAVELCAAHDRHALVLDHLGKPAIHANDLAVWQQRVQPLRSMPHVYCKLSGLVTEAVGADRRYSVEVIKRYLDGALEIFGAQRVMFGSDWPVCLLAAPSYVAVYDIVRQWASRLSSSEQQEIFGDTAQRCYGLAA
jgi:L-fucono-1,5-lactonase